MASMTKVFIVFIVLTGISMAAFWSFPIFIGLVLDVAMTFEFQTIRVSDNKISKCTDQTPYFTKAQTTYNKDEYKTGCPSHVQPACMHV